MAYIWPIMVTWLLLNLLGTQSDEEDPLQHVAQVAAREKQLSHILQLLHNSTQFEDEPDKKQFVPCVHKVIDLKVTDKQVRIFDEGRKAALRVANLLNNLLLGVPSDSWVGYPPHVFYALVRAALEGEPSLVSLGVAFIRGTFSSGYEAPLPHRGEIGEWGRGGLFAAYAYRRRDSIRVQDLAVLYNYSYDHTDQEGTQWFTRLNYR